MVSSEIINNILGLLIIIIIARMLGDAALGIYSFVFAISHLFMIFSDFGLMPYTIREIARKPESMKRLFGNMLAIKMVLSIIAFGSSLIYIFLIDHDPSVRIMIILASLAVIIVTNMGYCYRITLQAHEVMHYEAIVMVFEKIALFIGIGWALYTGHGLFSVFLIFLIVSVLNTMTYFFIVTKKFSLLKPQWKWDEWRVILRGAFPFWLTTLFTMIYFKIDTLMLSWMTSFEVVGWYNAAYKLLDGFMFLPVVFLAAIFPTMSRLFKENKDHLLFLFSKALKILLILSIPLAVGVSLLANRFILFIYPQEFSQAGPVLQILIWSVSFMFINYLLGYTLNAVNLQKQFTITTTISVIVNIMLNFYLIPKYSLIGASYATVVTQILSFILLFFYVSRAGFSLSFFRLAARPILAAIVMGVFIIYFSFLHILILVPAAMLIYFLILILTKAIGKEEVSWLKHLFDKSNKNQELPVDEF